MRLKNEIDLSIIAASRLSNGQLEESRDEGGGASNDGSYEEPLEPEIEMMIEDNSEEEEDEGEEEEEGGQRSSSAGP